MPSTWNFSPWSLSGSLPKVRHVELTPFSRLGGKVHRRWFPRIALTVLPPRRFEVQGDSARARRAAAGRKLYDVMSEAAFASSPPARKAAGSARQCVSA